MFRITRYHDISAGHRVWRHEGACGILHGHNYRIHFTVAPKDGLDAVGRVIDFSAIKERLCAWLDKEWDHKMLLWCVDPAVIPVSQVNGCDGLYVCTFNPTAENMAEFLVLAIGPSVLDGTGVTLVEVTVEETAKCKATYSLPTTNTP